MNNSSNNVSRAFSLVEVLMAVLILGLGLLGLGAIMPAVVKQQRVGTDQTLGTLAGRSVAALVKGNALLTSRNGTRNTTNVNLQSYNRWEAWARSIGTGYSYQIPEDGTWRILEVNANTNGVGTASALIGPIGNNIGANDDVFINLTDRLIPSTTAAIQGSSSVPEPQFVVDLAVRRVTPIDPAQLSGGNLLYELPGNFTVQMAFIVRRIDQRIRTADNVSLMQTLTDASLTVADRKWPLSEDAQGNPLGDGANTGGGRYSLPYAVNVTFDPGTPDQLIVEDAVDSALPSGGTQRTADVAFRQVSQPGQTIIDNLGNIYTVQGSDERVPNGRAFRISPPVAANVPGSGGNDRRRLHQIVVCAQPPAAVNIVTVNP